MENTQNRFINEGWIVEVDITHRCNLKCRHCNRLCNSEQIYNTHRNVKDMDERHIIFLCSQIRRLPPGKVRMIRVLGGEPILSPILKKALESFESLRKEGFIQDIVVMTNGTVDVPDYLQPYIIHYPPKVQEKIDSNGAITIEDVYSIKDEKHVNITISPADIGLSVSSPCDRYIGCGIHYTVYGFSLSAPCFPTLFVFQKNHRYFIHRIPSSIKEFVDEAFTEDVCSVCVYGLRLLGIDTGRLCNTKIGNRWSLEVKSNKKTGFSEPDTSWIKYVI